MDASTQVALITGAAKRVGRTIALTLAKSGFDIAFTYLSSQSEADSLVTEITSLNRRAISIRADLTHPESAVADIHAAVTSQFSRLDVLVNNASLYLPADLAATTPALLHKLTAIHVESPLLLCQKFEPLLRAARGHVVNMVDLLAERPWPQYLPYCASKAALANLTLGLARALAPDVTVNGIAPGVVEWPHDYPLSEREKYHTRVPLARAGTPEDVAAALLYFVTAGAYVTGQILRLDGGRSLT
jgi:pteridine reductase